MNVSDCRIDTWFPPGAYLRENRYPAFHRELFKLGRYDLSWKMDACCCSAQRLDCWSILRHMAFVPVACHRRTCPECSRRRYHEDVSRYLPIERIAEHLDHIGGARRIRFWTFTCCHPPIINDYRPWFLNLTKAVRSWFHSTHDSSLDGGLFSLEVGVKGGPHIHALISGPFLSVNFCSLKWSNALKRHDLPRGNVDVELSRPGSILELVCYPLDPDKVVGLDETLLARIESGFSGSRAVHQPSIRRQWTMGTWSGAFPLKLSSKPCPDCLSDGHISGMTIDHDRDCIHNKGYQRNWFIDHPDRWKKAHDRPSSSKGNDIFT